MKNNILYFNCLRERHSVCDCRLQGRCQICSRKHQTSLCTGKKKENVEDADQTGLQKVVCEYEDPALNDFDEESECDSDEIDEVYNPDQADEQDI